MRQSTFLVQKRVFAPGLLLFASMFASCSTTGVSIEKPAVTLSGVEMNSLSFSGQSFLLSFDVSNPNPFPLPIRSVRYHLQLANQTFASGETQGDFLVPASGDSEFDINVQLDLLKSAGQLTGILRNGMREPVPYQLSGSLAVDIPYVKPLPFSTSGVIAIASN